MFLMLAAKQIELDASLDEIPEIDEGIADLEEAEAIGKQGRRSPYWGKVRERLIQHSSTDNVDEAIREWADDGSAFTGQGVCELCDKSPIKFQFPIKNRVTGRSLVVGSECILNYLTIAGYENPAALKKRLVAQRNMLKKKEKGEASDEQIAALNATFDLDKELRLRLKSVSNGAEDIDLKEYRDTLMEAMTIANSLKITSAAVTCLGDTNKAVRGLGKFMEEMRKKQKSYQTDNLVDLLETIMRQRDPHLKLANLQTFKKHVNNVFQSGPPSEVIARAWNAIKDSRDGLLEKVVKNCDEGKLKLMDNYADELAMAKPYSHLYFMLTQGLTEQRKQFDAQVNNVEKALQDESFFEELKGSGVAKILNMTFYPDLANSEGSLEQAAYNVGQFLNILGKGFVGGVTAALESLYAVRAVRDRAGVIVALLKAADDGLLDADVLGSKTLIEFEKMVRAKDAKILALVQTEVDDIAELAAATGNMRVVDRMSKDLDIDMEKVFKVYAVDREIENSILTRIYQSWKAGRGVSPNQMGNMKKQLAMKRTEVANSMWQKHQSELTGRFTGGR